MRNAGQGRLEDDDPVARLGLRFDPGTNVVDVLVHRLREKIDRDFEQKLLHTVRGVGYVLRAGLSARAASGRLRPAPGALVRAALRGRAALRCWRSSPTRCSPPRSRSGTARSCCRRSQQYVARVPARRPPGAARGGGDGPQRRPPRGRSSCACSGRGRRPLFVSVPSSGRARPARRRGAGSGAEPGWTALPGPDAVSRWRRSASRTARCSRWARAREARADLLARFRDGRRCSLFAVDARRSPWRGAMRSRRSALAPLRAWPRCSAASCARARLERACRCAADGDPLDELVPAVQRDAGPDRGADPGLRARSTTWPTTCARR